MEAFLRRRSWHVGQSHRQRGFTLVEILVVLSIIAILASVVSVYALQSGRVSRDAQRQADLRKMQAAVELYKQRWGRYPAGCNAPGTWSGELGSANACITASFGNRYIYGDTGRLFSEFMERLPLDPARGSGQGYAYMTNTTGTVYKIIAMDTVESETVSIDHPMKSCDVKSNQLGSNLDIKVVGLCGVRTSGTSIVSISGSDVCHVRPDGSVVPSDNTRFEKSYAVWGGYADMARNCDANGRCINPPTATSTPATYLENFEETPSNPYPESVKRNLRHSLMRETAAIICS